MSIFSRNFRMRVYEYDDEYILQYKREVTIPQNLVVTGLQALEYAKDYQESLPESVVQLVEVKICCSEILS